MLHWVLVAEGEVKGGNDDDEDEVDDDEDDKEEEDEDEEKGEVVGVESVSKSCSSNRISKFWYGGFFLRTNRTARS